MFSTAAGSGILVRAGQSGGGPKRPWGVRSQKNRLASAGSRDQLDVTVTWRLCYFFVTNRTQAPFLLVLSLRLVRNRQPISESPNRLDVAATAAEFVSQPPHVRIYRPGVND
jgi:hypothetical protein